VLEKKITWAKGTTLCLEKAATLDQPHSHTIQKIQKNSMKLHLAGGAHTVAYIHTVGVGIV
jgi:hypothetical protein